jgi:N-acetylmuramoyl-L-alanine amidase
MASFISEADGRVSVRFFACRLSSSFKLLTALCCVLVFSATVATSQTRKQEARLQFEKAEQMREALNGRPESERTRRDYQRVADAYRKVYYVAPASSKADASVMAVAELLAAMGRQFQPGDKDLQSAIGQYQFLRREYPGSKYRVEALFTIGQIYKDDLADKEQAQAAFEEFLRRYPHDQRAAQARQALADLQQPKPVKKDRAVEARVDEPKTPSAALGTGELTPAAALKKSGLQLVTGIRHWSSPESTRVAIDVDGPVEYQAGRVPNPDRIFFDLPNTKLASTLVGKSFDVQDGFLKKIRVAQYQHDAIRVVLEVQDLSEYSAFVLPNPYRLIIDVHGKGSEAHAQVAEAKRPAEGDGVGTGSEERSSRSILSGNIGREPENKVSSANSKSTAETVTSSGRSSRPQAGRPVLPATSAANANTDGTNPGAKTGKGTSSAQVLSQSTNAAQANANGESGSASAAKDTDALLIKPKDGSPVTASTQLTSAPTVVAVAPKEKSGKKRSKGTVQESVAIHEATPTSAGDRSLIRALGLKIGRIVIDAGHGGHDTGTIGPNGLMEKEVVLDVALRLGRLLETRLGADVIYTRDDDTFIPLETRTAIANEKQADLFISIHANSSPDPAARGIETYYLNFTSNADALEVAARENAVSEKSIHELQDLVKKITLKEKIEESRELASDVQQSLYTGLAPKNAFLKNRGVKKAPFVVLIGANMPSVLAEISFVSNPTDEKKLDTPEYRQKIADSLYKGIAKYAGGLSGVKVASKMENASK